MTAFFTMGVRRFFSLGSSQVAMRVLVAAACFAASAQAQTVKPPSDPVAVAGPAHASPKAHGVGSPASNGFKSLTPAQQKALAPLAAHWGDMREINRLKWLEMVRNFHSLPVEEQELLHSRMVEWSNLSYEQRTQARQNFAAARKMDAGQRKAQWEAYQALSAEERSRLIEGHTAQPTGAARSVRLTVPQRLATLPSPVTPRHRPTIGVAASQFDQKTLLPQHISSAPAAPAAAVTPVVQPPPEVPAPAAPVAPLAPAVVPQQAESAPAP